MIGSVLGEDWLHQRRIRIDLSRVWPLIELYFWRIEIKGKNILEDNIIA